MYLPRLSPSPLCPLHSCLPPPSSGTTSALRADFQENYYHMKCSRSFNVTELGQLVNNSLLLPQLLNESGLLRHLQQTGCQRENSLLFLLLMLGTVWLAVSLYNFNKTPYLQVGGFANGTMSLFRPRTTVRAFSLDVTRLCMNADQHLLSER